MANAAEASPKLFLSYSRLDSTFVDDLIISIESYGFDVVLDRQDLFPGERWEPRLQKFISEADTTVCVVSQHWVASKECVKELQIALDQGRRVIPIAIDPIRPAELPPALAQLQFIFFHGAGRSFSRGVVDLISALRTDIDWVREQSRLLDKAQEWNTVNRSPAMLLRGEALARALDWLGRKRPDYTSVAPLVPEFLDASRAAEQREAQRQARGRLWLVSLTGLALIATLLGVLFVRDQAATATQARLEAARLKAENAQKDAKLAEYVANAKLQEITEAGPSAPPPPATTDVAPIDLGKSSPAAASPGAAAASAPPIPAAPSPEAPGPAIPARPLTLTEQLNASDAETRLRAGQQVADQLRGPNPGPTLDSVLALLDADRLPKLSAAGRFNVLYMLNSYDAWKGASQADALAQGLRRIEDRSRQGYVIGGQTQDCIDNLKAKLAGQTNVSGRCGGR